MKNSLFKRAIAAAAAVPLTLTQCPTFTNAVSINAVKGTAQVQAEEKAGVTLEDILYIPADQTVSKWNKNLTQALSAQGEKSGTIDFKKYAEEIIAKAGDYQDLAQYGLDLISNVKYELNGDLDLVITGDVAEPDFNEILRNELDAAEKESKQAPKKAPGRSMAPQKEVPDGFDTSILPAGVTIEDIKKIDLEKVDMDVRKQLAEKYEIPEIADENIKTMSELKEAVEKSEKTLEDSTLKQIAQDYIATNFSGIDFSGTKIGGKFTLTINGSDLKSGTTVTADFKYECSDGKTYFLGQLPEFAKNALTSIKKTGDEGIEKDIDPAVNAAIKEKFDDKLDKFIKAATKSDNAVTKLLGAGQHSKSYTSVPALIADVNSKIKSNNWLKNHNLDKQLPATATDIAANSKVLEIYEKALKASDSKINISAQELGQFADSLVNIKVDTDGAKGTAIATFPDSEKEIKELQDYLTKKGYVYEGSYKKLTANGDLSKAKEEKFGSVDIQLERVLQTNTTTTSTTTTTTTTTTTSSSTSSSTTSSTTTPPTTTPQVTTRVVDAYLKAETEYAFYYSIEEAFDKAQLSNVKLHGGKIQSGYTDADGKLVITDEGTNTETDADMSLISFGTATPANTYKKDNANFRYDIPVYYNGVAMMDEVGDPFTIKAYIGVKGDTNLDGIADAVDASLVLRYYAHMSTGKKPYDVSASNAAIIKDNPSSVYEELAVFLSDVQTEVPRLTRKGGRVLDAVDSSRISKFYAKRSSSDYESMTNKQLWDIVDKIAPDPNANAQAQENAKEEASSES